MIPPAKKGMEKLRSIWDVFTKNFWKSNSMVTFWQNSSQFDFNMFRQHTFRPEIEIFLPIHNNNNQALSH